LNKFSNTFDCPKNAWYYELSKGGELLKQYCELFERGWKSLWVVTKIHCLEYDITLGPLVKVFKKSIKKFIIVYFSTPPSFPKCELL
jgi:hypothetical protein